MTRRLLLGTALALFSGPLTDRSTAVTTTPPEPDPTEEPKPKPTKPTKDGDGARPYDESH